MAAAQPSQAQPTKQLLWDATRPAPLAHALLLLLSLAPLVINVPTNFNIVATASLTVYCGSWRSVKPEPPAESMTKKDAMRFPLVGSCVLLGLFLLFKFVPKWLVNALLSLYLGAIAVVVMTAALTPYMTSLFPASLREVTLKLPKFSIPYLVDNSDSQWAPTLPEIACSICSSGFCAWYYTYKNWFANNALGLVFSLEGIEFLSLGSTHVGVILLCGLFVYDIFWVFCTPVMVNVAKNFDAPIKLLFPRGWALEGGKRPFAMLGLGDIVIPGIFVALMLRYDAQRHFKSNYFVSAFGGYVLGLATTIFVMNYFQAAQPALLYIVPSVLGCVFIHACVRREFKEVFDFSEARQEAEEQPQEQGQDAGTEPESKKDQ